MKELNFTGVSPHNFHLCESASKIERERDGYKKWRAKVSADDEDPNQKDRLAFLDRQINLCESKLLKLTSKSNTLVTGFTPEEIEAGDVLIIPAYEKLLAITVESVSRRDHQGIFNNPQNAVGSFFEVIGSSKIYVPQVANASN